MWPIYVALVAITWLVNYPGRLNPNSLDMLTQAQNMGELNDWHAPSVTWLWSLFTPLLGQPAGALLVQSLLMFVYPAITQRHAGRTSSVGAAIGAAMSVAWVAFLIALIAVTGQIVKDVFLVGLILCLLAVLDLRSTSTARSAMWLSLGVLLAFILLARPTNFIMLALAGVIWTFFVFDIGLQRLMAVILILAGCAASFLVSHFVNRDFLKAGHAFEERMLVIYDIAGISSGIKQDLFVELPNWPRDEVVRPWECYTPKTVDPFVSGACHPLRGATRSRNRNQHAERR